MSKGTRTLWLVTWLFIAPLIGTVIGLICGWVPTIGQCVGVAMSAAIWLIMVRTVVDMYEEEKKRK